MESQLIPIPADVRVVRQRGDNFDPNWIEWYYVPDDSLESGWRQIGCKVVPNPFFNPNLRPDNADAAWRHPIAVDMSGLNMIFSIDPATQINLTLLDKMLRDANK